jgi:hypothetical protein
MSNLPKPVGTTPPRLAAPRQLVITFESPLLSTMSAAERRKVVACVINLLIQAAGATEKEEDGDDER